MVFKTRLRDLFFKDSREKDRKFLLNNKNQWSIDSLTKLLCLLLIGFLIGNLFGTFLNTIREHITWDGVIVLVLIVVIEILNYNVYHNTDRAFFFLLYPKRMKRSFWRYINFLKIGCMIGFFVDAFKVGSWETLFIIRIGTVVLDMCRFLLTLNPKSSEIYEIN